PFSLFLPLFFFPGNFFFLPFFFSSYSFLSFFFFLLSISLSLHAATDPIKSTSLSLVPLIIGCELVVV
ncbi:unnamed protein product, partial [Prunus brigantina]